MAVSPKTRELLRHQSANLCALCLGPAQLIGQAAHIRSPRPRGPRPSPEQSATELDSLLNLMHACPNCHGCIDKDSGSWPIDFLQDLRTVHESYVRLFRNRPPQRRDCPHAVDALLAANAAASAGQYPTALFGFAHAAAVALASGAITLAVPPLVSMMALVFFRTHELGKRLAEACFQRVSALLEFDGFSRADVRSYKVAAQSNLLRAQLHQPDGLSAKGPDVSKISADTELLHTQTSPRRLQLPTIVYGGATILENSTAVSGLFPVTFALPDHRYVGLYYFYKGDLVRAAANLVDRGLQYSGLDDAAALAASVHLRSSGRPERRSAKKAISKLEGRSPSSPEQRLQEAFRANLMALKSWARRRSTSDEVLEAIGRRLAAGGEVERANVRMTPMYYQARQRFPTYDAFCRAATTGFAEGAI